MEIYYINDILKRKINLSYTERQVFNESKYTFHGSIIRTPYQNIEDFYSLGIHLKSIGKEFSTSMTNDFNLDTTENILKKIASSFQSFTLEVINGNEWFDKYYPRKD